MNRSLEKGFAESGAAREGADEPDARSVTMLPDPDVETTRPRSRGPASVAIIGVGCVLPGAGDPDTFWRNLIDRREVIREIPASRWDWRLYYDADPSARDKISSRWGGFVEPFPFDPLRYGIPPVALGSISPSQLIALEVTLRALRHAGLGDSISNAEVRERTAVIFGTGNTGDLEQFYAARTALPLLIGEAGDEVLNRLPEWTEESYAGILPNVVAGRVANRFDLGGPNLTVDAACASSLAALDLAVRELEEGRSDLVIAGGIDFEQTPQAFTAFSKTRALSPRGRACVFDEGADGIVISEGAVVMVLKRLADAERDGDRILAVIRGVAGSSDGKGMGMTAPRPLGQRRALDRAFAQAGIGPGDLGLYEAHGTGTAVGDAAEVETIDGALRSAGAGSRSCVIGSAKTLIGHTRGCAGMVGLLKVALSLHHQVLPPHPELERPLERLRDPDSPMSLLSEPRPWLRKPGAESDPPRRAGVSAFGFGGTNYHAVLEEYRGPSGGRARPLGGPTWPVELFVFAAANRDALLALLDRVSRAAEQLDAANSMPGDGEPWRLADLARAWAGEATTGTERAAITASTFEELRRGIAGVRDHLANGARLSRDVVVGPEEETGDLAFLFPGQGSQYPGMGNELALYFGEVREALERVDAIAASPLSPLVLPPAALSEPERLEQRRALAATNVAQPAIGALSLGLLDLVRRLGLAPARVAGHSYGELAALHAAGVLCEDDFLRLSESRGRLMNDVGGEPGGMAAVALSLERVKDYVEATRDVVVANHNAPEQVVISGPVAQLEPVLERLKSDGHAAQRLAVSTGFHSAMIGPARPRFEAILARMDVRAPRLPVHSNFDGRPYPNEPDAIRRMLAENMERRVNFVAEIEAMYDAGTRTFLELGPGRILTGLVGRILAGRPHVVLSADGDLRGWLNTLGRLFVRGFPVVVSALFEGRPTRAMDLNQLPSPSGQAPGWLIDGGRVWRLGEAVHPFGSEPFLNRDTLVLNRDTLALNRDTLASPSRLALVSTEVQPPTSAPHGDQVLAAYREYSATMRTFLEQQERIFAGLMARSETTSMPARHSAPVRFDDGPDTHPLFVSESTDPPEFEEAIFDRSELTEMLVTVIIDRTGYPREVLQPNQDFEAELGIDSIKRVEIINEVVRRLPPDVARRVEVSLDRLSHVKTVNELVEVMLQEGSSASASARAAGIASAKRAIHDAADGCPRFLTHGRPKELIEPASAALSGLHLVTADRLGVAGRVGERLRELGATVEVVRFEDDDEESGSLEAQVAQWRHDHGAVQGIVHLTPLGEVDGHTLTGWKRSTNLLMKRFFRLLQLCVSDFKPAGPPVRILAVTRSENEGPTSMDSDSLASGGLHGLLRVVESEYSGVVGSVVEFEGSTALEELGQGIVHEFVAGTSDIEVRYHAGQRLAISVHPAPHETSVTVHDWRPGEGSVVLATGGARGITAELCREIAAPGVRLIIVGRSPLAIGDAGTEGADERRENIESFRRAGAVVEYHAIDVRDEPPFGALIDSLYERYGRIDAVLHGAGLIEDQRLEKKGLESFARVFDTKVDSTWVLSRRLRPETLKWVILFSSVSGRFGNQGQADYAAANETINRMARDMDTRWPSTRVVAINWGPWSGTGMAVGVTGQMLEARGFVPITPEAGRRFFVEELARGSKGDVQVVAGDGPWRETQDNPLGLLLGAVFFLLAQPSPTHNADGQRLLLSPT